MNFCSHCGTAVVQRIPEGDNRHRHICPGCGTIHYSNPRIVAGTIPVWEDKVLLCRRAIAPRHGYWTLPAGYMENTETTMEAALRETWEEAQARVDIDGLYCVMSVPHIDQVHMYFRASLVDGRFSAGEESLEVALFREEDIPWDQLAFPTIQDALQHYFRERRNNHFTLMVEDIRRPLKSTD
ncbi:MAG: NUDIX hydrolase [Oleiphilaceae bacterium]|nr:NUDIX hydrolase [Oleiphilaceae bacterium]